MDWQQSHIITVLRELKLFAGDVSDKAHTQKRLASFFWSGRSAVDPNIDRKHPRPLGMNPDKKRCRPRLFDCSLLIGLGECQK